MNNIHTYRMDRISKTKDKVEIIRGKSYLQSTIETRPDIIKNNKLSILNYICTPQHQVSKKT